MTQPMKEKVLHTIQRGKISMRPRWHFILRSVLWSVGGILLLLTVLYLASFILFLLHENGVWFAPLFGLRGMRIFFFSLPWTLILVSIIFVLLLELVVQRHPIAYRRPLLISALSVILIVIVGGTLVMHTSLHPTLFLRAREHRLPVAGRFYRDMDTRRIEGIHRGMIVELRNDGFVMEVSDGTKITVLIHEETKLPAESTLNNGDKVMVVGEYTDGTIRALGVRTMNEDSRKRSRQNSRRGIHSPFPLK